MKKHDDYPWLDNMLSEHLKRTSIPFDFDDWARAHPQQAQALQDKGKHSIKSTTMPLWRRIMKSPYTKIAAVIGIGVTVFSFLFPFKHGVIPESVALADVQAAIQSHETVFTTGTRMFIWEKIPVCMPEDMKRLLQRPEGEDGPVTLAIYAETYLSPQGFVNKVFDEYGSLLAYGSIHNASRTVTLLLPPGKVYIQFELPEAYQEVMAGFTLQGFINMAYQSGDSRKIGPEHIQGIDAMGFEVTDWQERIFGQSPPAARFILNIQEATARAWIDPQTKLPIQTESEGILKPCVLSLFEEMYIEQVDDYFEWGLEIDPNIFLPEIPEDYKKLEIPGAAQAGFVATSAVVLAMTPLTVCVIKRRRRKGKK